MIKPPNNGHLQIVDKTSCIYQLIRYGGSTVVCLYDVIIINQN